MRDKLPKHLALKVNGALKPKTHRTVGSISFSCPALKYKYLNVGTSSQNRKEGIDVRNMLKDVAIDFARNSG